MGTQRTSTFIPVFVTAVLAAAPAFGLTVYPGSGTTASTAQRDDFRTALGGGTVAGANGLFGGVRREINWDATPDAQSAPNALPPNFFNVNSPRGVVFGTPGTGFQVSANAGVAPVEFDNINATYSSRFNAFSAQRLFTPTGSNVTDINFFVAGTTTPALTRGFGSIFTSVNAANTTSIEFFDVNNASLGTFFAPTEPATAFDPVSFLGVDFGSPVVSRVRITTGNTALGPNEVPGQIDIVVMDDFVYGEPVAVPEPASLSVLAGGAVMLLRRRRKGT